MKEKSNYLKIEEIFNRNDGFVTRKDIDEANIPSWFLSNFVKRNSLNKVAPGIYATDSYIYDEYYILQKRYSKYVFSGINALYLNKLTDKIPTFLEVSCPQGYNPRKAKDNSMIVHQISNKDEYSLGIKETRTMFGNVVKTYDEERTICDLIKYRDKYDSETFVKAIRIYAKNINDQIKLMKYARILGVEKKVFEIMEILMNEN